MAWLAVTDEQRTQADALNAASPYVRVCVVRGTQGGWITEDGPQASAVPGGYYGHFADWFAGLTPSDDVPVPQPPRPTPRPRP